MPSVLMTVLLAAAPAPTLPAVDASLDEVTAAVRDEAQTGTLLFSRGDCLAVKVFGGGPYTHVAAIVMHDGQPFVYDSANGAGVRRLPLTEYIAMQQPDSLTVMQPRNSFEGERVASFRRHLEAQLDRPYGVKHHLTGKRAEGVHCAEYVTDALCEARLIRARRPPRVSPASLAQGVVEGDVYSISATYAVQPEAEPVDEGGTWCSRMWMDTKTCTTRCCRQMSRWFLCR